MKLLDIIIGITIMIIGAVGVCGGVYIGLIGWGKVGLMFAGFIGISSGGIYLWLGRGIMRGE